MSSWKCQIKQTDFITSHIFKRLFIHHFNFAMPSEIPVYPEGCHGAALERVDSPLHVNRRREGLCCVSCVTTQSGGRALPGTG